MAGSASVLADGSALSRADRALVRLERVLALASGLAVFGLMVLAVISVGGRNLPASRCAAMSTGSNTRCR